MRRIIFRDILFDTFYERVVHLYHCRNAIIHFLSYTKHKCKHPVDLYECDPWENYSSKIFSQRIK